MLLTIKRGEKKIIQAWPICGLFDAGPYEYMSIDVLHLRKIFNKLNKQ